MLKAGFAQMDVTPPLGTDLSGYFYRRLADGILDPLYIKAAAVSNGAETVVLMAVDYIGIKLKYVDLIRAEVTARTGVPGDHVMISALHQHTSPCLADEAERLTALKDEKFTDVVIRKFGDTARMAIDDLQEARLSAAQQPVRTPIAFVRRYFTESNGVQTNPSGKYKLTGRCAEADNTLRLLKFTREGADDIAILNFSTHPDVVGGAKFSADWPGFARRLTEAQIPGVRTVFFTGCQGDSNHIDFFLPKEDRLHGKTRYEFSRYMGETVAEAAVAAWDKAEPVAGDAIFAENRVIYNRTNDEGADQYEKYKAWYNDYEAGRLESKPHITELAYASRVIGLRNSPIFRPVPLTVIRIGGAALVGFGGEAFTAYGAAARALAPDKFVICAVCTNGYEGYFPTEEAFRQGGYEAMGSYFTPTLEREIVSALKEMFENA